MCSSNEFHQKNIASTLQKERYIPSKIILLPPCALSILDFLSIFGIASFHRLLSRLISSDPLESTHPCQRMPHSMAISISIAPRLLQSAPRLLHTSMLLLIPPSALMDAQDGTSDHPFNTIAAGDVTFQRHIQKLTSSKPISSHNKLLSPRSLVKRIYGKLRKICCNYFNPRNHQQLAIHLSNSVHQC